MCLCCAFFFFFFFSSRRRHTRCALVTGVQTCALPICFVEIRKSPLVAEAAARQQPRQLFRGIPGRGGLNHSAHLLDIKRLTPPGSGPARNLSDTAVRDNGGKAIMGVDPYPGAAKAGWMAGPGVASVERRLDRGNLASSRRSLPAPMMTGTTRRSEEHTSELQSLMRIS